MAVELPSWSLPFQWTYLLDSTTPDAVFYSLEVPQLEKPWQAFHLSLQVLACSNETHQAVATLRVPWSHQHSSVVLRSVLFPCFLWCKSKGLRKLGKGTLFCTRLFAATRKIVNLLPNLIHQLLVNFLLLIHFNPTSL